VSLPLYYRGAAHKLTSQGDYSVEMRNTIPAEGMTRLSDRLTPALL